VIIPRWLAVIPIGHNR